MSSTPASRKLYHVCRYIIDCQMMLIDECRRAQNWDTFDRQMLDLIAALVIVSDLRAELL